MTTPNTQKGFIIPLILALVVILGGVAYYRYHTSKNAENVNANGTATTTLTN